MLTLIYTLGVIHPSRQQPRHTQAPSTQGQSHQRKRAVGIKGVQQRLQKRWAPRHRPGQARSFKSRMPMSFAPPTRGVPGLHRISGHGRCSARHPCRIQPPKGVHGQKGEAKAAKSKNGNAGWNPGTALPVRIGAKPERLAPGRCGLNGFRRARGISSLHFTSSGMPARASALSLRSAPVDGCSRQSPKPASNR